MKEKIIEILKTDFGRFDDYTLEKIIDVINHNKEELLKSILEELDNIPSEYHYDHIKYYLNNEI